MSEKGQIIKRSQDNQYQFLFTKKNLFGWTTIYSSVFYFTVHRFVLPCYYQCLLPTISSTRYCVCYWLYIWSGHGLYYKSHINLSMLGRFVLSLT